MVVSCQSVGAVSPGGLSVDKSGKKTETNLKRCPRLHWRRNTVHCTLAKIFQTNFQVPSSVKVEQYSIILLDPAQHVNIKM